MIRRVLFMILLGVSLVLAGVNHFHQAANAKLEQSLAMLESMPKAEFDRFHSDAKEFYQSNSKAARDEQKRLRRLYNQIQNDPENERLAKTLNQYVEWINSINDLAIIRDIQTRPINERVEIIQKAVQEERSINPESPVTTVRLKASLPSELQSVALSSLFDAFDTWLTKRYDEIKSAPKPTMNEEQIKKLPEFLSEFETFYRGLYHSTGIEASPTNNLGIPEKMAMIQLIQNLSVPPRVGVGGSSRFGGGSRPGGGGGPFPFESGGLRGEFLGTIVDAIDSKNPNPFLDSLDRNARQVLERNDRLTPRTDVLQVLLALAVLERYPKTVDSWRSFQANTREEQDWIKLLGNYLSMMTPTRREEFLKLDSRYTTSRLQFEIRSNVSPFFGLIFARSNRDRPNQPSMGPPSPMPPRSFFPPDPNSDTPPRPPENRQDRNQGRQSP